MLNVSKEAEPRGFADCKRENSKIYDLKNYAGDYNDLLTSVAKATLQESLCKNQGFLCCYCMQRINHVGCPNDKGLDKKCMRVEHYKNQSDNLDTKFEYSNLLAVCHGYDIQEYNEEQYIIKHCDEEKGDKDLKYSPKEHDVESFISYMPNGTILSKDDEFDQQLDTVLNLNIGYLADNRKAVWSGVRKRLKSNKKWTKGNLRKLLETYKTPNAKGELKEYCGVAIYYLKKKLRQAK